MEASDRAKALCADCISRQAALDALNHELRCGAVINQCGLEMAYEVIEDLPPAQPKRGKWIPSDTDGFVCSVCRNGYRNQPTLMGKPMFEFCPVCGAKMGETE